MLTYKAIETMQIWMNRLLGEIIVEVVRDNEEKMNNIEALWSIYERYWTESMMSIYILYEEYYCFVTLNGPINN